MMIKWDIMVCMIFFLLLSEVSFCDSSYREMRSVSRKYVRDLTRNIDRFGSLERIRLRSYRTLDSRNFPSISHSEIYTNEAGSAIKNVPQNFDSLNFNRIVLNRENPTTRIISNLRLGSRLIGERQRESFTKLRNVITKAHLSNKDITTEESRKKITRITRDWGRNDRRVTNGFENRFFFQTRENRLRSRRSIVSPKYNIERRTTAIRLRNADSTNLTPTNLNDASEIRQPAIGSRKERVLAIYNRHANRENIIQGRSDKKETIRMKSRYSTRNARSSKLLESFPEQQFHKRQSELRRERNSLVSRRELKIPDLERIRSEDSRKVRRNVRSRVVRDKNIEETTQNRRNGRGFRGRIEKRNAVEERRDNSIRVKVLFLNQRIEISYQKASKVESVINTQRFVMHRVNKVSRHRYFSHTGRDNSLSGLRHNRVARENDFDTNIRQDSDGQIIREIRKTGYRARLSIFNRARRFTMRMEKSAMDRNSLNTERRSLPYCLEEERHTLVANANNQDIRLLHTWGQNKPVQSREGRTLRSQRKLSVRGTKNTKQFVRNVDKTSSTSTRSALPSRFSVQIGDSRAEETSRQIRNNIVRNRRVGGRKQQLNKRVSVERQREISGEHRGIFNERFRSANENYKHVRNQLKEIRGVSKNHVRNSRIIKEKEIRTTHRKREVSINSEQHTKMKSLSPLNVRNNIRTVRNTAFNDARSKNHKLFKNRYYVRLSTQYPLKSYGFKQSNASEKLCTLTNANTKYLTYKMAITKNSIRLSTSARKEQHELGNLSLLKSYNQARWTLYEYISQKKSSMVSFVFNIILGLAVIVAMSDDINKGLTSRLKNQFRHSIFKYLKVG